MKTFTQRCSQLNWRTFVAGGFKTFLVLFLLSFLTPNLNAQITVNGQPGDWCSVIGGAKPNLHVRDVLNGGNDDTEFTEGTSDVLDIPDWVWGIGVISDKTDLGNVGLVVDGCTVYFFADRFAANGDADLGLWLFKNQEVSLNPDGSFNGTHVEGDILITSKFTNGGGAQTTKVYIWTGGQLVLLFDTAEDASKESIASGTVNSSQQTVPCGWDYTSKTAASGIYPTGTFYEGRIDLCLLEQEYTEYSLAINECFANFIFKTSQSPAPTSANGDLVFGNINSLPEEPELTGSTFCAGEGPGTVSVANSSASIRYYLEKQNGGDWDPVANSLGNGSTLTFNNLAAGTYRVRAVNINTISLCETISESVDVIETPAPNANAGADKVLTCTTTSLQLSGSSTTAGATFSWVASNGGFIVSGALTATPTVNAAGTYTLTVTADGCTATDVALVTLNNTAPNANAGADKELTCTVTSIMLSGSSTTAGATFSWVASNGGNITGGALTATPTVNAAGTYTLTVTDPSNGCTATDVALVTLNNTAPNANAGADKELTCTVTSIMLSGSSTTAGATFSWVASNGGNITGGALTATPTVNAAGTYTLTVTDPSNGCTATDVALVTLDNTVPNANAGADKELTCTVTSIMLSGSSTTAGATFSWVASNGGNITGGALTATPTVNAAGTYTLTVTDPSNGCTATDVALVTLNNTAPNANAGADKVLTCTTTSIMLSGSSTTAGATFSWVASNGGNITANANTATPTVNAAGTYTLTVTDPSNGCTATDVALVTLNNTAPNANAGADKELTCTVTSIMLSGSSTTVGATFSWVASNGGNITAGALTATPTVNAAGTYTLTVTDPSNGCTATDVALVTLDNTAPNANAGADKELTCTTTSIMLSGSSTTVGATFSWVASNGGNITAGALTATPTVNAAGTYTLTVTDPSNGCTAMDVALVTLDNTAPNANAGADKELTCTITSIMLSGSSTTVGATFSWVASNGGNITAGALTATPTVNAAGTYTLTVTDPSNGCTAMDVALVTLDNTTPNANAGADKELTCTTTSIILAASLNPSPPDHSYSWVASNGGNITAGALTATPTVNAAGTYTLTVTNLDNGCTATDVALVTLNNTPPNANAGADKELTCTVTSIMLSGSSTTAGATFSWVASNGGNITGGALTATPTVNAAGTYTLTVTNPANGCTATDVALVTLNNTPPNANAGADKEIPCGYSTVMLSGSSTTAGATFSWVASNGGNIVSGALTATPTVNAAGTYTLTVTNPANGCTATDIALVTIGVCPELFCTYTQGYFGNAGGKACDGETGGLSTTQLINQSISNWGGSILIGSGTRSVTIETGDADWVIKYLPGGGQSYALSGPAIGISSPSFATLYTKKAGPNTKINNTLLAQTITLGLNLGINDDLASFSFATHSAVNKYLVTQEPESCGSTVGVPDSYTCDELNPAVVALLKQANWPAGSDFPATVAGLFQLANYALGGGSLAGTGVDLNSIAGAADAINNAFDECRLFVGFRETCPVPSTTKAETESLSENSVSVTAFPNPYTDRVRFVLRATISGQAALEIYNSMGQRVATPFRGFMNAGSSQVVDYTVPANQRENLFYLMRVNDKQASGKLLNLD